MSDKQYVAKCVECKWSYTTTDLVKIKMEESSHASKTGHIVMHGKTT